MAQYIETQTDDGATIKIEVKETIKPPPGFASKSASNNVSGDETKDAYQQSLQIIRSCANGIIDTIQNLQTQPSTATADFAIKIDGETGAMIAKAREDAHFRVSLSWKQVEAETEKSE